MTGELDYRVQAVFVALARAWDGDSQSTEGLNSRVRQRTQKAPNLGLDTLNADIGTSSMIQLGTKERTTRLECSEVKTSSRVPRGRARVSRLGARGKSEIGASASPWELLRIPKLQSGAASLAGRHHLGRMNSRRQRSLRIGHGSLSMSGLPMQSSLVSGLPAKRGSALHSCCRHCWTRPLQPQRSFGDGEASGKSQTRA